MRKKWVDAKMLWPVVSIEIDEERFGKGDQEAKEAENNGEQRHCYECCCCHCKLYKFN